MYIPVYVKKYVSLFYQDADSMQRDINFTRSVMAADFEHRLNDKAIEL